MRNRLRDAFWRCVLWLCGERRVSHYAEWLRYENGPTGYGTGPDWMRPDFPKPWLPSFVAKELQRASAVYAASQRDAFATACREVLGEDPADWIGV